MMAKIECVRDDRGIHIGTGEFSYKRKITLVNPSDRDWTRHNYVISVGAYGDSHFRVWAQELDDAIEIVAEYFAEHVPGYLLAHDSEELAALVKEACEELGIEQNRESPDFDEDELWRALDHATVDLTYTESGYITSYEWSVSLENPTRAEILAFIGEE